MDRLSLLEQKRQRLQELKNRRKGESIDTIIEKLQTPERRYVNVGVQAGKAVTETYTPQPLNKETVAFEKAVQATPEEFSEPIKEEHVEKEVEVHVLEKVPYVDEYALNQALMESIKLINKVSVREVRRVDTTEVSDYTHRKEVGMPFTEVGVSEAYGRTVCAIDISPHFDLVVAAYKGREEGFEGKEGVIGKEKAAGALGLGVGREEVFKCSSLGFAVVFNGSFFPEFFLQASSPIKTIQFDRESSTRVIGGLANGKVVVWDWQQKSRSVALLPVLSTPRFSALSEFRPHTRAVSEIIQMNVEGNDALISFSRDGVVNTWSSSVLAAPRMDSVVLEMPKNEFSQGNAVRVSRAFPTSSKGLGDALADNKHLNGLVVVAETGEIVHLSNKKGEGFIGAVQSMGKKGLRCDRVMDAIALGEYLVTAHMDWTIKIWSITSLDDSSISNRVEQSNRQDTKEGAFSCSSPPLLVIPTDSVVRRLYRRPNTRSFVAVGRTVQLWDLDVRLFGSVLELAVDAECAVFSKDGRELFVGGRELKRFKVGEVEEEGEGIEEFLSRAKRI